MYLLTTSPLVATDLIKEIPTSNSHILAAEVGTLHDIKIQGASPITVNDRATLLDFSDTGFMWLGERPPANAKHWFRKNGFKPVGYRANWRVTYNTYRRSGLLFRINRHGLIDIGKRDGFDRWANSTYRTLTWSEFIQEYGKHGRR